MINLKMESEFQVTGIGEVLWDIFPEGERFGGAPANFACHAQALGTDAHVVSCVGKDQLGQQILTFLETRQINTSSISCSDQYPTGTVQIQLDPSGHPQFEIGVDSAWDFIPWSGMLALLASTTDAVCYGTLSQRNQMSRDTIQRFLESLPSNCLRILDVNLRQQFYDLALIQQSLRFADVLKLSDEELPILASVFELPGSDMAVVETLMKQYDLRLIALTRGEQGAILVSDDQVSECQGVRVEVADTVGAGDAFTAAMTIGLLRDHDLEVINHHACRVAAFICSQAGAVPDLPHELQMVI